MPQLVLAQGATLAIPGTDGGEVGVEPRTTL